MSCALIRVKVLRFMVFVDFFGRFVYQLASPTMAFLIGGIVIAACGTRLVIPDAIYKFIVFLLLMTVGLEGGLAIREANLLAMFLPAIFATVLGVIIVFLGRFSLLKLPGVNVDDGIATAGLFGAVSGSTLAATLAILREQNIVYEAWAPALYPFMDIPALITAIVLANWLTLKRNGQKQRNQILPIITESLRGPALTAMLLGFALGLVARTEALLTEFYDPLFRGMLSILMLVMGMDAYKRLGELRAVAHWYVVYAAIAPLVHGCIGFGLGYLAHLVSGFSPGGVVVLAVIASSSSDISGPPTLRAGIPNANPSAYVGSSTGIGTPVAIAIGIPLYTSLAEAVFAM